MAVTQTVDIPADRRITLEVPREVPPGRTILTFTPAPATPAFDPEKAREAIKNCTGLFQRLGINLSSDEFLEMRRRDREIELFRLHADELNAEAEDVLLYQTPIFEDDNP